jgi:DNA-3-methyladenine glycosylase II
MFTEQLTLKPVAPFNFELTGKIFSDGDEQIRKFANGEFFQVLHLNGKLVLLTLISTGTVEAPELCAELKSNQKLTEEEKNHAANIATNLFNLNLDLKPFYDKVKKDPTLSRILKELFGLRSPTTQTVYEALVDSIIEQQISLRVAISMERKTIKEFGETMVSQGKTYYAYPSPQALAKADIKTLTQCGLSSRKAEYIKEISRLIAEGKLDLEKFKKYEDTGRVVEELDAMRGIGVWTAELTVLRSMQKWDAMPADDVGLRRIIAHYYCKNEKITAEETRKIAEPWGMWRGLAAFYFVVAELVGLAP